MCLFFSIIKRKKHSQFKFFPFYFTTFIILQLEFYCVLIFFIDKPYFKKISLLHRYTDTFVTLTEFFAFMYFFYHVIKNTKKKKLIKWLAITGIATGTLIILTDIFVKGFMRQRSLTNIYILESSIMLIPCYFYYRELFSLSPKTNLLQNANFWTVTGLSFYLICTLPITFVLDYLANIDYLLYTQVYSIIYVFYIFFFILIIKSYLCKPTNLT